MIDRERKMERYPYCVLIATQVDRDVDPETRTANLQRLQSIAQSRGINFIETSAKTGQNVDQAFMEAISLVWNNRDRIPPVNDDEVKQSADNQRKKCILQ
eukprot:TRINITY_DN15893_c0_g1_i1.p2 TRINITY_DN15893_c0_g1~~TRINITY_DN15893_c0_g1_i1.p2  ORF type:complete len:100 (-),score=6.23 TRINITY_DN15893_c0_g1_i1:99-398(-)